MEKSQFIILGVNIRLQNSLISCLLKEKKENSHIGKNWANNGSTVVELWMTFLIYT